MTKHRQETMFPQQCFLVCPGFKFVLRTDRAHNKGASEDINIS